MGRQLGFHILESHFFPQGIKLFLVMCFWFSFTGAPRCFRFEQRGPTQILNHILEIFFFFWPQWGGVLGLNSMGLLPRKPHSQLSESIFQGLTFHFHLSLFTFSFPGDRGVLGLSSMGLLPCTPQFHVFESTFPLQAFFKSHCLFPNEEVFWGGAAWVYSPASLQAAAAAMAWGSKVPGNRNTITITPLFFPCNRNTITIITWY